MRQLLLPALLLAAAPVFAQEAKPGPSGYHLAATFKPGGEGGWDYLTVDPAAHRLYLTRGDRVQVINTATHAIVGEVLTSGNRVQVIDTDKGTVVGEIPGIDGGHGVALAPEFNRGFVSSGKDGKVLVFDLKTLKAVGEPLAVGEKPDAIIYEPMSKHVFSFNGKSEDATVIDAATAKVVATIPLGGSPEFAASDEQGTLYVNLEDKSEVLAIDVAKNTVTHRWPLAPGDGPSGLALDAKNHRLFSGCHNEMMIVMDAESGKVLASPAIGKGVDACAFDPGTGCAFASCGDGTMTVVREEGGEFKVLETVATKPGARTMALDPETHAVYLAAADYEPAPTPAPGGKRARPKMVDGSFVVLKFVR